jgi:hypothetical protein
MIIANQPALVVMGFVILTCTAMTAQRRSAANQFAIQ